MGDGGVSWTLPRHQTLPLLFCLPEIKTWGAQGSECGRKRLGVEVDTVLCQTQKATQGWPPKAKNGIQQWYLEIAAKLLHTKWEQQQ